MTGNLKLDRLDIRILCQLQKKGRLTNVENAAGLSPSPCPIRVKRLEKAGHIFVAGASSMMQLSYMLVIRTGQCIRWIISEACENARPTALS